MSEVVVPTRDLIARTVYLAAVVASIVCAAAPVAAGEAETAHVQITDARSQYREAVWGLWMHRRMPSIAPTVAAASTPITESKSGPTATPDVSSIHRVSTMVGTSPTPSGRTLSSQAVEISRPVDVQRALDSMGPDAAGRLAAADSGMRLVLQVGSFLDLGNARVLAGRLSELYSGVYTSRYNHHGRTFHRVRIARFSGGKELDSVEHSLRRNGHAPLRILTPERPDLASYRR